MIRKAFFEKGLALTQLFCELNAIAMPKVTVLRPDSDDPLFARYYHLPTCAFYQASMGICIAVAKCALPGTGGRAWSWPGYAVDRTPYGVLQHELGHHVDEVKTFVEPRDKWELADLFSFKIWSQSKEKPLTGYLGTDREETTFYKEWFAENFRLFVTNPDLSERLRPKFYAAMLEAGFKPAVIYSYWHVLCSNGATDRILKMAEKKVLEASPKKKAPEVIENNSKESLLM